MPLWFGKKNGGGFIRWHRWQSALDRRPSAKEIGGRSFTRLGRIRCPGLTRSEKDVFPHTPRDTAKTRVRRPGLGVRTSRPAQRNRNGAGARTGPHCSPPDTLRVPNWRESEGKAAYLS